MHKETQRNIFVLNISAKCKQILKLHTFENNIFNWVISSMWVAPV